MRVILWGTLILTLVATIIAATTEPSDAQTPLRLEQLQVDLWPEFDRPEMLVIYRGTLPADTPLPATLNLRLPAQVGQPHAVAYGDGSGNLFDAAYSTTTADNWVLVTMETPALFFQLEFYDSLTYDDEQRDYTFTWPGDYAVDQLNVSLLPPPGAVEIRTEPLFSSPEPGASSLSYWSALGSLAAGQESQVMVSYNGAAVSVGEAIALPIIEERESTQKEDSKILLIAVLVAMALLLVISGTVWYTRRPKPQQKEPSRPQGYRAKGKRRRSKSAMAQDGDSLAGYCTHCGRPLGANDRFCSNCGTQVKRKTGNRE